MMKKFLPLVFLSVVACGSKVTGIIPGITTQPVDVIVKDLCENPIANKTLIIKSNSGEIVKKSDEDGRVHVSNISKPYSITLDAEYYLTYYSTKSSLTIYDPSVDCESRRDVRFHGNITAPDSITGTLKLFVFPGEYTSISGSGNSVPYDISFPVSETSTAVYLVAVEYRDNKPYRLGKAEVQLPSGATDVSKDISLNNPFSGTLEGALSGFNERDKVAISYTFLFGSRISTEIHSVEVFHGFETYTIPIPPKGFLSTGEKIAVFANAQLFTNATGEEKMVYNVATFDRNDYPSSGRVSENFTFIEPPDITSPKYRDSVSLNDFTISWDFSEIPDYYLITFDKVNGETDWMILIDYPVNEITPEFPSSLTPPFSSMSDYLITLVAVKIPEGGLRDIIREDVVKLEGGYAAFANRRIILK